MKSEREEVSYHRRSRSLLPQLESWGDVTDTTASPNQAECMTAYYPLAVSSVRVSVEQDLPELFAFLCDNVRCHVTVDDQSSAVASYQPAVPKRDPLHGGDTKILSTRRSGHCNAVRCRQDRTVPEEVHL